MSDFSIDSLSPLLTTSSYEMGPYEAYEGFQVLEGDIRAAHPEKYTPIQVTDPRFSNTSWINIHAWSLTYLTLWCIVPERLDGKVSFKQYFVSLAAKPIAALFDGAINTALVPVKLLALADRVLIATVNIFLQRAHTPGAVTAGNALNAFGAQTYYMGSSFFKVLVQPLNICSNVISPKWDLIAYFTGTATLGYEVLNEDTSSIEILLDQNRIKFLREKCGWQHVTDDLFKTMGSSTSHYALSYYVAKNDKLRIKARWEDHIQVGNTTITIPREDRNY